MINGRPLITMCVYHIYTHQHVTRMLCQLMELCTVRANRNVEINKSFGPLG